MEFGLFAVEECISLGREIYARMGKVKLNKTAKEQIDEGTSFFSTCLNTISDSLKQSDISKLEPSLSGLEKRMLEALQKLRDVLNKIKEKLVHLEEEQQGSYVKQLWKASDVEKAILGFNAEIRACLDGINITSSALTQQQVVCLDERMKFQNTIIDRINVQLSMKNMRDAVKFPEANRRAAKEGPQILEMLARKTAGIDPEEILRHALACCTAIECNSTVAATQRLRDLGRGLDELALHKAGEHNCLLASSKKAVYCALPSMISESAAFAQSAWEMGVQGSAGQQVKIPGTEYLAAVLNNLEHHMLTAYNSERAFVLCGFRVGGALAHRAAKLLIRSWNQGLASGSIQKDSEKDSELQLFSLAFGSPPWPSQTPEDEVEWEGGREHFWNFVLEGDNMPGLLLAEPSNLMEATAECYKGSFLAKLLSSFATNGPKPHELANMLQKVLQRKLSCRERPCIPGEYFKISTDTDPPQISSVPEPNALYYLDQQGQASHESTFARTFYMLGEESGYAYHLKEAFQLKLGPSSVMECAPITALDVHLTTLMHRDPGLPALPDQNHVKSINIRVEGYCLHWLDPEDVALFMNQRLEIKNGSLKLTPEDSAQELKPDSPLCTPSCLLIEAELEVLLSEWPKGGVTLQLISGLDRTPTLIPLSVERTDKAATGFELFGSCDPYHLMRRAATMSFGMLSSENQELENQGEPLLRLIDGVERVSPSNFDESRGRYGCNYINLLAAQSPEAVLRARKFNATNAITGSTLPDGKISTIVRAAVEGVSGRPATIAMSEILMEKIDPKLRLIQQTMMQYPNFTLCHSLNHMRYVVRRAFLLLPACAIAFSVSRAADVPFKPLTDSLSVIGPGDWRVGTWDLVEQKWFEAPDSEYAASEAEEIYLAILKRIASLLKLSRSEIGVAIPPAKSNSSGSPQNTVWHEERALSQAISDGGLIVDPQRYDEGIERKSKEYKERFDGRAKWTHGDADFEIITADYERLLHQMNAIYRINALRGMMAGICLIGIVGLQDAGKSLLRDTLAEVPRGDDVGQRVHSARPVVKQVTMRDQRSVDSGQQVLVMDMPGMNPAKDPSIAEWTSTTGADMFSIIFVTDAKHDMNSDQVTHLLNILKLRRPVLVCANKAYTHWIDAFQQSNGRMPTPDEVAEVVASWDRTIQRAIDENPTLSNCNVRVMVTELVHTTKVEGTGVCGVEEIRDWIADLVAE